MIRCQRCLGSKKIAPMGGIYVTCPACNGVGFSKDMVIPQNQHISEAVKPINSQKMTFQALNPITASAKMAIDESQPTQFESKATINTEADIAQKMRNKPGRKPGWNKVINPV